MTKNQTHIQTVTNQSKSAPISSIKVTRCRSQQTKTPHYLKTKLRSNKVIHASIGLSNNIDFPYNQVVNIHNKFRSVSATLNENKQKNISMISSSIKSSENTKQNFIHVSKIPRQNTSLTHSSQNIQLDDYLYKNLQESYNDLSIISTDQNHIHQSIVNNRNFSSGSSRLTYNQNISDQDYLHNETKNTWANSMDYINKKNQNLNKKKKKYSKLCCIISLLIILILIITTIVLLVVFLTKSTTSTTTNNATIVLRWNSTGITVAGISGVSGTSNTHLNNPWGVALSYDNTLYIADRYNHRIQRYPKNSLVATTVAGQSNGTGGSTSELLYFPAIINLDSNENLYIADGFNHRAQFWEKDASSGVTVAGSGNVGSAANELSYAYGLTRDSSSGLLYVVDHLNHRIMAYKSGNVSGWVVAGGNGPGLNNTQLNQPMAVCFDSPTNSLVIANFGNHNIIRWILGENNWLHVASSIDGISGDSSSLLNLPTGLTVDPMGNVYVADLYNHRIQLFLKDQLNGTTIAGITGKLGNDSISLNQPYTLTLDSQLNLYVADNQNHRIQKFLRY